MTTARRRAKQNRSVPSAEASWRLAIRGPIEAYDEYSDKTVELTLGQDDPSKIEGLVVDFRYISREREVSRRSLLCWQCWRIGERIYVRGYCPFREELRTFRVDRMADVVAMRSDQDVTVDDPQTFFAAFAAEVTEEISPLLLASVDL